MELELEPLEPYVYYGTESEIPGIGKVDRYGQVIMMNRKKAEELIKQNVPITHKSRFDKVFPPGPETDAALAEHPSAADHGRADVYFRGQTKAVRLGAYEEREELRAADMAKELTPPAAIAESDRTVEAEPERQG